jgi:uncharacterized cupredoxin-like copper-binding protein
MRRNKRLGRAVIGGLAVLALSTGLVACGDDDEKASDETSDQSGDTWSETGSDTGSDSGSDAGTDGADAEAVCAAIQPGLGLPIPEEDSGEPIKAYASELVAVYDAVAAATQDEELKSAVEERKAEVAPIAESGEPPEEVDPGLGAGLAQYAAENCDVQSTEVSLIDYGFEGLPGEVPAGLNVFVLENAGEEDHEMVLLKKNDPEQSAEDILALPEEEAMQATTFVGFGMAAVGESGALDVNLEPGSYIAVCFFPVGGGEDGPPHFTEGMVAEFTVA